MNIVQIIQKDNLLQTDGTNCLGYQNSSNIPLHLLLETNGLFSNFVKTVTVNIPGLKKTVSCVTDWNTSPAVVTLPQDVFKCEGSIYIALFGTDGTKVINTNALAFEIDESNSTITFKPDERLLEEKIMEVMMQWYEIKIKPDYELLVKNAKTQQVALNQRIEAFDDKVAEIDAKVENGDFDGATILHGFIDPTNDLGKDGDQYINESTTSYHLFFKENGEWVDKGSIRGIDGNNKILVGEELETSIPKALFIKTITQSQAISETRRITVNEYDARLPMNQVRISDEIWSQGLDEYISKKIIKAPYGGNYINNGCQCMFFDGHDLNILKETLLSGYVADGINRPINENGYLTVTNADDGFCVQTYQTAITCCTFRRQEVDGTWTGWKLIAGEMLLWSGSAKVSTTFNVAHDISMFSTLRILLDNTTSQVLAPAFSGSDYCSASANISSGSSIYSANVLLQKISAKTIKVSNVVYVLNMSNSNHGPIKTDSSVIAIYGRP